MFVKIYIYHIKRDKTEEYFRIQEKAREIYRKFIDSETTYLQSRSDTTKWIEITKYRSEEEYDKGIALINTEKEIQELFKSFQSILVDRKREIVEENFIEVMNTSIL
ncbi:hypothetical protein [Evansella cellulosilytica]|uniref:ABM domain-containing protein n=1 Tax=Evansella cellulosilytica (strain ATCC 21833 / DSM 2522 / FERM P-1141 / JCM 9156 / N-4) TaxID=649639 RepID=E6TSL7_EVAC2|nr:hypothetical protein [Evansella cellulosilytica]ADU29525.1 hypothetical protein Bcell_1260 [Evansella cellulosilytica DSM 2522]